MFRYITKENYTPGWGFVNLLRLKLSSNAVWLNNSAGSSCVAIVIAQEPAKPPATPDLTASASNACL